MLSLEEKASSLAFLKFQQGQEKDHTNAVCIPSLKPVQVYVRKRKYTYLFLPNLIDLGGPQSKNIG